MENLSLIVAGILISLAGMYVCARPAIVAARLKRFYSRYPLVRYAGMRQLTARPGIVRVLGVMMTMLGILSLVSLWI